MEKPLVSIIIAACNDSATISRCLESALAQDYDNLMVVALDNHSSDNTYDVLVALERLHRNRLYIGRTFTRVSPSEHRKRCMDLFNPRTLFVQYLSPTDVLAPDYVSSCLKLFASTDRIGCVLTHADVIDPAGAIHTTPGYRSDDCVITGEAQMESFMAHGLETNTVALYRIEVYKLSLKEGLAFNRFPTWLPLIMASSISDMGYIRVPLAFRGDLRSLHGERFIPSLEDFFEHYLFLMAFTNIAARLERQSVCDRFPEALSRLSRDCVRCADLLRMSNQHQRAMAYRSLALAYLPEIADTEDFKRLGGLLEVRPKDLA